MGRHAADVAELCGALNPDYPDEYACTLLRGHAPAVLNEDGHVEQYGHAAPDVGAYWTANDAPAEGACPATGSRRHTSDGWGRCLHCGRPFDDDPVVARPVPADAPDETINETLWMALRDAQNKRDSCAGQWARHPGPDETEAERATLRRALDQAEKTLAGARIAVIRAARGQVPGA